MLPSLLAFQAVPPAQPGGKTTASEQAAPPPEGGAPPEGGGFSSMLMILMFVPLLLFMFWQSRSQQKKQETAINSLKKGDRVVTQSGLIGRLIEVETRYAKLELAPGVKVQVLRTSLLGRDGDESPKPADKGTSKSSDSSKPSDSSKSSDSTELEKKSDK